MTLQKQIELWGYKTRSYSGRGMYGKTCLGVELDTVNELFALGTRCPHFTTHEVRTDTLGYGIIVYFPNIIYHS